MSRILSIAWYKVFPPEYGGQKGIALFTRSLSRYHDLVFLCSKNNHSTETGFKIRPVLPLSKLQFLDPFCRNKIIHVAKELKPDYIILEHPYHGFAGLAAAKKTGAKLVVHSHNIESERFRRMGKWWWRILRSFESRIHRHANLNLFKTDGDLEFAVEHFRIESSKCLVIPYCTEKKNVDQEQAKKLIISRHQLSPREKILLFAGTLDYAPNAKAVEFIYHELAPKLFLERPGVKIMICGRNRSKNFQHLKTLNSPNVLYAGEVDDIENYFAAADVFIDPVNAAGGIQTKIIEALGYDLNVVCFEELADKKMLSLSDGKIFVSGKNDIDTFMKNIFLAMEKKNPVTAAFFEYFNWENQIKKLNEKLSTIG